MPGIENWGALPAGVRQHLIDRMHDRAISVADLNRRRLWIESKPEVPEGDWYKDFGSVQDLRPGIISENVSPPGSSSQGTGCLRSGALTFVFSASKYGGATFDA
jgi:hypothetical protein